MPKVGLAVTAEQIRHAMQKHGNLRAAGKALGIGDSIYKYASQYNIKSNVQMSEFKKKVSRDQVLELSETLSSDQIAVQLGCNRATIYRILAHARVVKT